MSDQNIPEQPESAARGCVQRVVRCLAWCFYLTGQTIIRAVAATVVVALTVALYLAARSFMEWAIETNPIPLAYTCIAILIFSFLSAYEWSKKKLNKDT